MKSWEVPYEWVQAMLEHLNTWPDARELRVALAAVAPLVAKAERERVLQVLSAHEAGYAKARASYQAAQNAEMTAFVGGKETALGVAIHAIRALGDEG